ncbi:MAG: SatD family protein [Yoonia sp.]
MDQKKRSVTPVIMGDIVGSESFADTENIHSLFNSVIEKQNVAYKQNLLSPLTITLGDEFQGLVDTTAAAIRVAREVRFELMDHSVDCRLLVGLVELKTPVNEERAWNMMGPGLSRAREKLNKKKANVFYTFSMPGHQRFERLLDALGAGLSAIERGWTERQRNDIVALLSGLSASQLAHQRNVSVHNIYKVRGSGDFETYVTQWQAIVEALDDIDKEEGLT